MDENANAAVAVSREETPYVELKGWRQIVYAIGHIGPGMLSQFITTWLLMYLTGNADNVILSGTLVGVATLCGRIIDGIADPLVANWSDNIINKKWGRRLPFMLLGTLPMILSFLMLWITGSVSSVQWVRFVWVFVWVNAFYFFYTVVVNPYFALLPEIAKDNNQRIHIQSFVSVFGILGMGISLGLSGYLTKSVGYFGAGVILSVVCALVMITPALTVKTNPNYEYVPKKNQTKSLIKNVVGAFKNKSFVKYIVGFATFYFGFQLIQYNMAFITIVLLKLDSGMSSTLFIVSVVCALAFIPVYNILVKKLSATGALMVSMLSYALVALLIALIPVLSSFIPSMILGFALMALLGFPYSGLMVIPNVLVSEIIDEDYREFEVRREAMFFGVQGLVNKLVTAFASLVVGVFIDNFGGTVETPLGVILVAPIAAVFTIVGFFVVRKLNKKL